MRIFIATTFLSIVSATTACDQPLEVDQEDFDAALVAEFEFSDSDSDSEELELSDDVMLEAEEVPASDFQELGISSSDEPLTPRATRVKPFWVKNPGGDSYYLRLKGQISSGSGKIKSMSVSDTNPFFEAFGLWCNSNYCKKYVNLGGCNNFGSMLVNVEYTGSVSPSLKYWFYDC
jgi:hypothetical protein